MPSEPLPSRRSKVADTPLDRDEAAVELAGKWWPRRYVGDLSESDWRRIYAALDGAPDV